MRIYLAQAIDRNSKTQGLDSLSSGIAKDWPDGSIPLLMFKPAEAFVIKNGTDREENKTLLLINETALHNCDILLVLYQPTVESWGVPQEALLADRWDIPVFVLSSVKYRDLPNYLKARTKEERVKDSIKAIVEEILEYA